MVIKTCENQSAVKKRTAAIISPLTVGSASIWPMVYTNEEMMAITSSEFVIWVIGG